MEHPEKARLIHHYDRERAGILCGIEDRTAHWTTRRTVNCPRCSELLRAREQRPSAPEATHAADAG
ncbi:hypothetical protein [Anaeromyxobacter terrae]|uniref:hypothetical protein n=1 Tax=Anaeromyxobacter terrae TaxID=2925406 RepID=UPI001F5850BF|nr:hypothetical protein [Anaeromyxobacter sp. SG22]